MSTYEPQAFAALGTRVPGDFVIEKAKKWELISGVLSDGAESLVLKMPTGETFCAYAPGRIPYQNYWTSYYNGFPKQDFSSREACVTHAEKIAGHRLEVRPFESYKKAVVR